MPTYVVYAMKIGEDIRTGIHEVASPAAGNACMRAMDNALSKVFQREQQIKKRMVEHLAPVAQPMEDPILLSEPPVADVLRQHGYNPEKVIGELDPDDPMKVKEAPEPATEEPEDQKHLLLEWVIVSDERRGPPAPPRKPSVILTN